MHRDNFFISVVIPAYNEAGRITDTLESVIAYFAGKSYLWQLVVVNDGSQDETSAVVEKFSRRCPLMLLDNRENKGKGAAVRQGMLAAEGDIALFMDADNATKISELDKAMPFFVQEYDVVIGSRRLPESRIARKQPFMREFGGRFFGFVVRILFGLPYLDTQAGFKVFSRRARETIFREIRTSGWAFDVEALVRARDHGFRIAQIPIAWHDQRDSKVKPLGILRAFWDLFRLKILLFRGK